MNDHRHENEHSTPSTTTSLTPAESVPAHEMAKNDQAADPASPTARDTDPSSVKRQIKRSWRFWAILGTLSVTGLLSAIEGTIITTSLPTIIADLGGGELYIWVANAFFLSSVATLPLYGQASNILGRRWLMISAVALFTLGSGLSGGASTMTMLIAGRTVQGLGGGGINMLIELIVTDLVPLRERGQYMAVVLIAGTLGAAIGPFIGGVITSHTTWRWVFYLNVPIGGVALVLLFVFLHTNYQRDQTMTQRLARIDFAGNAIFILAIASVLIALTWGGTVNPWSSYRIIVPLILGLLGLALFTAFEWTPRLCPEPSFPRTLLTNRTSAGALALTFIHSIATYWIFYFLPIYFQSVQRSSPERSGVQTLPTFVGIIPFAMVGGVVLTKTGRYKQMHLIGFALLTLAFGLFSLLKPGSSAAAWVCFQLLGALGAGLLAGILLPAMQAPLDESLVATTTGVWSFVRGFGAIWGVTIPSAVFNNECGRLAGGLSDANVAGLLSGGKAYQYATAAFVNGIPNDRVRGEVVDLFAQAMRFVWIVGIAFAGLGFLVVFVEKEVTLRDKLNTDFGIQEKSKETAGLELGEVR